jgi:hypothetical protein
VGEPGGLPFDGLDDLGMRVAHEVTPQPTREIEQRVAVDIGDPHPEALVDHRRDVNVQRVRDHPSLPLQNGGRPGTGDRGGHLDGWGHVGTPPATLEVELRAYREAVGPPTVGPRPPDLTDE